MSILVPWEKIEATRFQNFKKKDETLVELGWRHDRIETTRHERNKNEMKNYFSFQLDRTFSFDFSDLLTRKNRS